MLKKVLLGDFVPHLPPLLDKTRPAKEQENKNYSRALSAFAIRNIASIPTIKAAKSVIDDFDDFGIDLICYVPQTETLYIVQSKLKSSEMFSQDEALAFCQGVRKIIKQDFSDFNENVKNRTVEIEDALENCSLIRLVVCHTGNGISKHAKDAIDDLLEDEDHGEERLSKDIIDYDADAITNDLRLLMAHEKINIDLMVQKCTKIDAPRVTYFGLVNLHTLAKLHEKHGKELYAKNIRTFLGHKTDVNISIQRTLSECPQNFVYLNNGVTALCEEIEPKNNDRGVKKLKLYNFSIINGAQTIASSAKFLKDNPGNDISKARVSLTLIKAQTEDNFGKSVTRARNHQNPVTLSNFAALDDEQERIRRELAIFNIQYAYKAEFQDTTFNPGKIRFEEAAQALALLHPDPRLAVLLKKYPNQILNTESSEYKSIFNKDTTPFMLVNAVIFNRYMQARFVTEAEASRGYERLTYRHGNHAAAWVMCKRLKNAICSASFIKKNMLELALSAHLDNLRNTLWDKTSPETAYRGPLSLFRNQSHTIPLLQKVMIEHYELANDPIVEHKIRRPMRTIPYPIDLFEYLILKAPQIGNIS